MNLGLIALAPQYDPAMDNIPTEVLEAVRVIEGWAANRGAETYEIAGLCSRDHAHKLRAIVKLLTE